MRWGFYSGNIYFIVEIMLAELIFLYPVPRRKGFWYRLPLLAAGAVLVAAFFPQLIEGNLRVLHDLVRFVGLFAVSVLVMGRCFRLKPRMLVSMCVAGYAVQHMAYRSAALMRSLTPIFTGMGMRVAEVAGMLPIYLVVLLTMGRFSARNECYKNSDMRLTYLSIFIVFICVGLSRVSGLLGENPYSATSNIYSVACCLLALYLQFNLHKQYISEREKHAMWLMRQEERKQYEITRNAMDSLHIKLHDLKHKLAAHNVSLPPEEMESLRRDMNIYDSKIRTGCDALDVLMTEKILKSQRLGIRLSCMGDFSPLSTMKTMDVYSLFGNAVDNAIEAVCKLEDADRRLIDITIEERGDMCFIGVTNYYNGMMHMEDGVLYTTKTDEPGCHGYGIKSMRMIAARYMGELAVYANDEVFNLNIYIRCPRADA